MESTPQGEMGACIARHSRTLPDLKPWREVGWIFQDGESVAIERKSDDAPTGEVEHVVEKGDG